MRMIVSLILCLLILADETDGKTFGFLEVDDGMQMLANKKSPLKGFLIFNILTITFLLLPAASRYYILIPSVSIRVPRLFLSSA